MLAGGGTEVPNPRSLEPDRISKIRVQHRAAIELAERILQLANDFFTGRQLTCSDGELVARLLCGLNGKVVATFWSLLVLAERGLPTSSLARELLETLISIAYITKEDSATRAQLYADSLIIQEIKDMNARLSDPSSADVVTSQLQSRLQSDEARLVTVYGAQQVREMHSWKTWAGNFTLQDMARCAGVPGLMYNLVYRVDSRAAHARDAGHYLEVRSPGAFAMRLPEQVEQHLMPMSSCVLLALKLIGEKLGVNRETELDALMQEVQRVADV